MEVCVCVWRMLACNPVKLLDNGGTAGLAFPRSPSSGRKDDAQHSCTAGRLERDGKMHSSSLRVHLPACSNVLLPFLGLLLALSQPWCSICSYGSGTGVVERLRGPHVPLVQHRVLGTAGEDFFNQFYWSDAIGLTHQGQAQSPETLLCKCMCPQKGYCCMLTL